MGHLTICAEGKQTDRIYYNEVRNTLPFLGVRKGMLGIGIKFPDTCNAIFQGFLGYNRVIATWQAMKLLEKVSTIHGGTLMVCLVFFRGASHRMDVPLVRELAKQFGGLDALERALEDVREMFPSDDELDTLLMKLDSAKFEIDAIELCTEMSAYESRRGTGVVFEPIAERKRALVAELHSPQHQLYDLYQSLRG